MRLVDGDEDVVGVVLAKWTQVREQMMQIGHRQVDARNLRNARVIRLSRTIIPSIRPGSLI